MLAAGAAASAEAEPPAPAPADAELEDVLPEDAEPAGSVESDSGCASDSDSSDDAPDWLEPCDDDARQPVYIVTASAVLRRLLKQKDMLDADKLSAVAFLLTSRPMRTCMGSTTGKP